MIMPKRQLGKAGPAVGCLGYGAMVLEGYYGSSNDDDAVTTIRRALETDMTMINSADAYGNGHNESLVGRALRGRREQTFVCTKFGIAFDPADAGSDVPTGWGFFVADQWAACLCEEGAGGELGPVGSRRDRPMVSALSRSGDAHRRNRKNRRAQPGRLSAQ
jgi:aryl-alcohol dehydrogenase-like predicted oxidoreductase